MLLQVPLYFTGTVKYWPDESCLGSVEAEVEGEFMGTERNMRAKQKCQLIPTHFKCF